MDEPGGRSPSPASALRVALVLFVLAWIFGPYTLRDSAGLILDWELDPVVRARPIALRNTLIGARFISKRTDFLDASTMLEEAALDRYVFLRDAYLKRRRSLIYDGNPPPPPRPKEPEE